MIFIERILCNCWLWAGVWATLFAIGHGQSPLVETGKKVITPLQDNAKKLIEINRREVTRLMDMFGMKPDQLMSNVFPNISRFNLTQLKSCYDMSMDGEEYNMFDNTFMTTVQKYYDHYSENYNDKSFPAKIKCLYDSMKAIYMHTMSCMLNTAGYQLGLTSLSDWSDEEYRELLGERAHPRMGEDYERRPGSHQLEDSPDFGSNQHNQRPNNQDRDRYQNQSNSNQHHNNDNRGNSQNRDRNPNQSNKNQNNNRGNSQDRDRNPNQSNSNQHHNNDNRGNSQNRDRNQNQSNKNQNNNRGNSQDRDRNQNNRGNSNNNRGTNQSPINLNTDKTIPVVTEENDGYHQGNNHDRNSNTNNNRNPGQNPNRQKDRIDEIDRENLNRNRDNFNNQDREPSRGNPNRDQSRGNQNRDRDNLNYQDREPSRGNPNRDQSRGNQNRDRDNLNDQDRESSRGNPNRNDVDSVRREDIVNDRNRNDFIINQNEPRRQFEGSDDRNFRGNANQQGLGRFKRQSKVPKKCKPKREQPLPKKWNWRARGKVTPARYQGKCGSCWTFTALAALESHIIIKDPKHNTNVDLSEQELLSCARQNGCKGGTAVDAYNYMLKDNKGVTDEKTWPYNEKEDNCNERKRGKKVATIKDYCLRGKYVKVNGKPEQLDDEEIMYIVREFGPVYTTINADDLAMKNLKKGVYGYKKCPKETNHAVTIVGWDEQSWIIKNSWGSKWGDEGFFRMKRGENLCGINTYIMFPII